MRPFIFSVAILAAAMLFSCNNNDSQPGDYTVTTGQSSFSPATLNVRVGDTITFIIGAGHNVIQVDEIAWNDNDTQPAIGFNFPEGTHSYIVQPSDEGTIYYVCSHHTGMKGKIVVGAK